MEELERKASIIHHLSQCQCHRSRDSEYKERRFRGATSAKTVVDVLDGLSYFCMVDRTLINININNNSKNIIT